MNKKYDTIIYIGRFQPFHNAHLQTLEYAARLADNIIVVVGSANQPRTHKNPFTFQERFKLIHEHLQTMHAKKLIKEAWIVKNIDTIYDDDAWTHRIQDIRNEYGRGNKTAIIGYGKDKDTIEYLSMFPQWDLVESPQAEILNATQIRDIYFSDNFNMNYIKGVIPTNVANFLLDFSKTETYRDILAEKKFIEAYRRKKDVYEYPIVAVTVDSVVICSGHVLLIKRKKIPGKGLWALPGGYFDAIKDKTTLDGIVRELKEETMIDIPTKVIRGSLVSTHHFSAPGRSLLGRSITFAGFFRVQPNGSLMPKVKGADDAAEAKWFPISEVKREMLFDDHFDIIQHFVPTVAEND